MCGKSIPGGAHSCTCGLTIPLQGIRPALATAQRTYKKINLRNKKLQKTNFSGKISVTDLSG